MSKDVPTATVNTDANPKVSWRASAKEVALTERALRSSQPEVIYQLDSAERHDIKSPSVVTEQIRESPYNIRSRRALTTSAPDLHTLTTPINPIPPAHQDTIGTVEETQEQVEDLEQLQEIDDIDATDEVFDSDSDMAEDKTITLSTFTGSTTEDADAWLRHFQNYCRYRAYDDAKSLALFKVLLTGSAATWLDSQAEGDALGGGCMTPAYPPSVCS